MAGIRKLFSGRRLLGVALGAVLAVGTAGAALSTMLFPSAAVTKTTQENLFLLPQHSYQFVYNNCNWANITNNYTDFTTNFNLGPGFAFSYNRRVFNDNTFAAGIFYDGRALSLGEQSLGADAVAMFRIPRGAVGHAADGTLEYHDVRVMLSDFYMGTRWAGSSPGSRPSNFGSLTVNAKDVERSADNWEMKHVYSVLCSGRYVTPAQSGSTAGGNVTMWLQTSAPVSGISGVTGVYGLACDVKIDILPTSGDWRTVGAVTGTVPMAWDDIDQPDRYRLSMATADRGSNTNAANSYNGFATAGKPTYWYGSSSDNFGVYTIYHSPFTESVNLKSGLVGNCIYTKGTFHCDIDGNRIIAAENTDTTLHNTAVGGFTCLMNASSTVRWGGADCGTQLFMDIGTYNLTIERVDSYGSDAGLVRNGAVTGGKYQGSAIAFPNDTGALWATAKTGYYIKSVSVDGVSKTVTDDSYLNVSFSNITANHNVKVELAPYKKIVTSVEHGTIDGNITDIKPGQNRTINYSPDTGYYLESITVDGTSVSITANPDSYPFNNIQEDHAIHVVYAPYWKITTEIEHGTVTPDIENIKKGQNKTVTWQADPGYFVSSVMVDGRSVPVTDSYSGSYTFSGIDTNHHVKVVCEPLAEITVVPKSANPEITDGNSLYNFAGLRYEIRNALGDTVAVLTMDEGGSPKTADNLLPGDYTIVSVNGNGPHLRSMDIGSVHLDAGGHVDVVLTHPVVTDPGTITVDKNWSDRE